jgi:hypothetical protein
LALAGAATRTSVAVSAAVAAMSRCIVASQA